MYIFRPLLRAFDWSPDAVTWILPPFTVTVLSHLMPFESAVATFTVMLPPLISTKPSSPSMPSPEAVIWSVPLFITNQSQWMPSATADDTTMVLLLICT